MEVLVLLLCLVVAAIPLALVNEKSGNAFWVVLVFCFMLSVSIVYFTAQENCDIRIRSFNFNVCIK